ncbi:hypothetical protein TCAL_12370 [Tigriopus californicus]|uniref:Uncharacterized protein n=1 Tax=Tigriopus californicus TaxID=6832 RepID=A0A553PRC4_TIGCA|nr:uncharacterized protein LOC131891596 [Tigriopus californicus]TRY80239.1 hypothetical protein TCAL_12370 [Tigriopus californicus]|eukprot:TCALIF_12370-PA protein Name:"Protein of unknown function" AED:0.00 eAED:0.00 QI:120/1/1/1/0.66/0.75/4/50/545
MDFRIVGYLLTILICGSLGKPVSEDHTDDLLTTTEATPTDSTTENITTDPSTETIETQSVIANATLDTSIPHSDYHESDNLVESESPYDYDPMDQLAMESESVQSVVMVAPLPKKFQADELGPKLNAMFVDESDLAMIENETEDPTLSPVAFVSIAPDDGEVLVPIDSFDAEATVEASEVVPDLTEVPDETTTDGLASTTEPNTFDDQRLIARDQPETMDDTEDDDYEGEISNAPAPLTPETAITEATGTTVTETIETASTEAVENTIIEATTLMPLIQPVTNIVDQPEIVEEPFEQVEASILCSRGDGDPLRCGSGKSKAEVEDLNQGNDVRVTLEDVVFHNSTVNADDVVAHQVVKKGGALSKEDQVEGSIDKAEGKENLPAEYRLLKPWMTITTTSTSIVAISTDILTVFSSCWRTAVPMTTCTGSMLTPSSGRRRRSSLVVEQPLLDQNGQAEPFTPAIQATKASKYTRPEVGLVQDSQSDRRAWAKLLLTYEQVQVLNVTSTVTATIVGNGYETLRFTSDIADPGCLPLDFLASNAVGPC